MSVLLLSDAAIYYFQNVMRFVDREFVPTEEDIVMARIRTRGMFMTEFESPPVHWKIVDVGGQRSERKKWMRFFDDVQVWRLANSTPGCNPVIFTNESQVGYERER